VNHRTAILRREARRLTFLRRCLLALATVCVVCAPSVAAAGQIRLAWDASTDPTVTGYRVYYGTVSGVHTSSINAGNQTTALVSSLTNGARYYFVVRSYNASGVLSAPTGEVNGLAGAVLFIDDPLTAGVHVLKVVHITELRSRINALRTANGLSILSWTDALTANSTVARTVHLTEMRTALTAVYVVKKLTVPIFTDPLLVAGTRIRAVHISELRAAVKALE
jgi:hypothetical protein